MEERVNYPKVSIIILNRNGLGDTVECLESLKKITYPNYEVIVIDNGSHGNDVQVLRDKFGDYIHLIENNKNYGACGGRNIGMRYALENSDPDYFLLFDNDTVVDPKCVTEMAKVAEADPTVAVAGAKIYYYDNPDRLQSVWGRIDFWRGQPVYTPRVVADKMKTIEIDRGQYDSIKEVNWVACGCFLIKKRALENIGFFDESYFMYWEEPDYCIRAKQAGYNIAYVPKAKIWHKFGQTTKKVTGLSRYFGARNRFRFMRKYASPWQYRCFLVYFFGFYIWVATGYYLIFHYSPGDLLGYWRGARDGLFNSEAAAKFYSGSQF